MKVRLAKMTVQFRTKRKDTRDISVLSDNLDLDYLQVYVNVFARNSLHIVDDYSFDPTGSEIRKYAGKKKEY